MSSFKPINGLLILTSLTDIFPPSIKAAFYIIIQVKGYINHKRFSYIKYIRLQVFLDNLNMKAINQVNHKTKYKALHDYELYNNGFKRKLYRLLNKNHTK
jgi:hypothetical protein